MTFIQIIDAFTFYGADVLLLAAATAATVQILKLTLLKKLNRKIFTFMPFCVGTLFYGAYSAAKAMSLAILLSDYVSVIEHGFAVGAAATLLYVMHEQFVRERKNVSATEGVISTLIEGYVPTDAVEEVAKSIAEAVQRDVSGNGAKKTAEILSKNMKEELSEQDIELLSRLIIETLAHLNAN